MFYGKKFMDRMGWNQKEFAKKMECGQPRISAINTGVSEPKYHELIQLINLGMTPEEMFGDEVAKKFKGNMQMPISEVKIDFSSPEFQKGVQEAMIASLLARNKT